MSITSSTSTVSHAFSGLKNLEERMNQALIDQPEAVSCVAEMIKRVKTGFYDVAKPRGVLVFAGPSGVGKTELAKMTAHEMGVPLHRFDMSEFSESHKVSRLLGSPPGYMGSDRGGELVNTLLKTPACVVLLDEIEKAHPNIYKIFLQLFDEGRLTDSTGREVIATQAVFILTTNLGSREIYEQMKKGVKDNLNERIKALCIRTFTAELYNRFDKVVVFRHLNKTAIEKIVEKYLRHLKDTFAKNNKLEITWDHKVVVLLSALNVDVNMGARDIHRKVKECVLPKLTAIRIEGKILQTDVKVRMKVVDGRLELEILDKGKDAIASEPEKVTVATEITPKKKETVILKDGVVYLDHAKIPLQQMEGKHVFRLSPKDDDQSYMDVGIKIIHISSIGEILYHSNNRYLTEGKIYYLRPEWHDEEWAVITPARNGRGFFENVCSVIDPPAAQRQALILVEKIFTDLDEDCYLSDKAPFDSLREYCIRGKKEYLLSDVRALETIIGSFTVKVLPRGPAKDSSDKLRAKL